MKKKTAAIIILAFAMAAIALASSNITSARASSNYSIQSVNHTVEVLYNGYVIINDTIAISGQTDSFLLGFPHSFGPNVISAIAYNANDASDTFPVTLNVPLEDQVGFYGVEVDFSSGTPQVFSVVFVLSNNLVQQNPNNDTEFGLVFPAFPSLTEPASVCNCSVIIPDATWENTSTISGFSYDAENLSAFTYNTSNLIFLEPAGEIQPLNINQFTRQVDINSFGQIAVSDTYNVTNYSQFTTRSMDVVVPPDASNIAATDQIGTPTVTPAATGNNPNRYTINFTISVDPTATITFTVNYNLPDNIYVSRPAGNFAVNMSFFQDSISYMSQTSVRFVLPDGAQLSNFATTSTGNLYDVDRGVYQETMSVSEQNVISIDSFTVNLSYSYNSLWLASGPTLWVWALAIVGSAVIVVWKRPRAPIEVTGPSTTLRLRPEDTRAFVDAYDEKMKIEMEIDALEARVQKGRIPRRRYKVQKKTLETRLSALDRTLAEAGGKMHSAGGHYSDLMRQLEVAETEIDEAEGNIKSIEARQNRGEITLETHRKLLADYERRKERAKTTINGILLRLREEIH